MHIISRKRLNDFAAMHPDAKSALAHWYQAVKKQRFESFVELRQVFPHWRQQSQTDCRSSLQQQKTLYSLNSDP